MSQGSGQGATQSGGDGGRAGDDVLLVECQRFSQLPGMWGKRVTVGADQIGFVMSKGAVVKELGSGTTKVGTSVLGLMGRNREVLRFRFRPFRLHLDFGRAHSDVGGAVPPAIELTALIVTPALLYSAVLKGQGRLYSSELATTIMAAVEGLLRERLAEAGPGATVSGIVGELDMPLRQAMAERGLQVEGLNAVS